MMSVSRLVKLAAVPMAVAVAFAAIAETASAQPPRGQRGGFQRGGFGQFGGGAMLLANEQVQEALDLSDDQKAKIEEIVQAQREQARERLGGFRDLTEEQRRERFEQIRQQQEEVQKQIDEVLTADQQKRLEQIQLQRRGLRALLDSEVAEKLDLSEEQQSQIRGLLRVERPAEGERPTREQLQAERERRETAVRDVLTSEQQAKFDELLGERVEIRFGGFGGREGGFRRGDGTRRGEGGQRPRRRGTDN